MTEKKDDKEPSWEEIGKAIGKKMEKFKFDECHPWKKHFVFKYREHGGGFGRLVFGASVMYALYLTGVLNGLPTWLLAVIVLGFVMMKL